MKKLSLLALFLILSSTLFSRPVMADDIVVFGATGKFGSKMVREALDRGHRVYGVSRSPEKFTYTDDNFVAVKGNPTNLQSVKEITKGVDGVLIALGDRTQKDPEKTAMNVTAMNLSEALADLGPDGPVVVAFGGGNTSADTKEEMLAMVGDRLSRPGSDFIRMIMLSQWATYETYRASNINWVFLAPPRNILGVTKGEDKRTGFYRKSADGSLDKESDTAISNSDIAVAAVDLIEHRDHSQARVAIAY